MSRIKIIVAILCLLCLFDMPYSYYEIFRIVAFIAFLLFAYDNYKKLVYLEYQVNALYMYAFFWLVSAAIVQPFYKLAIDRETWSIIDIIWFLVLSISVIREKKLSSKS